MNIGFPNEPGVRYRNLFIPRVKKPPSANDDFTKKIEKVWKFMKADAYVDSYRNIDFFECDLFAFLCSMENCLLLENVVISSNSWCKRTDFVF